MVEGLRTGEADRDLDGLVSLDEFYSFVHERVTAENPDQTPLKSFDVQGDVYVARRGAPVTTPAPLPRNLLETLEAGEVWERRGAVTRLAELLVAGHPGRALAAKLELERLRIEDDSSLVKQDAAAALFAGGDQAATLPEIPVYVGDADDDHGVVHDDQQHDDGDRGGDDQTDERTDDEKADDDEGTSGTWRWLAAGAASLVLVGAVFGVYRAVVDGDDDRSRRPTPSPCRTRRC